MSLEITTSAAFDGALLKSRVVVAYFWASWCAPCKQMDGVVEALAKQHPEVAFARVEAEEVDAVTERCAVATVPCFVVFKAGSEVGRVDGADPPALAALVADTSRDAVPAAARAAAPAAAPPPPPRDVAGDIRKLLGSFPVVLFMKGVPDAPRCGFSRKVVDALRAEGIAFEAVDILQDEALRQGLKDFSNWPTFPQLYAKGELLGGCDIVTQMHQEGQLKEAVEEVLYRTGEASAGQEQVALAAPEVAPPAPAPAATAAAAPTEEELRRLLRRAPVMLFMKGVPDAPRCGFSRKVVDALRAEGIAFEAVDILQDDGVRQGLKLLSDWPTYPQLYCGGQLLGGCDIVLEMQAAGELRAAVEDMASAGA